MSTRDRATPLSRLVAALTLSVAIMAIGGCASSVVDSVPTWAGGEPVAAPARPVAPAEYPAVNERPPARPTKLITEDEQAKVESQLAAARENQAAQTRELKKSDAISAGAPQPSAAQAKAAAAKAATAKAAREKAAREKINDSPLY